MVRSRAVRAALFAVLAGAALFASAGWGWHTGVPRTARFNATVDRVVDGDTIVVRFAGRVEKVRILGANTPETVSPKVGVQCYGPQASAYTHGRLPPGTRVTLETDVETRDKYGRLLAYVYVGGDRFDDDLLRLGYARLLIIPPNGAYAREMMEEEMDARMAHRGLWGACPAA
jgi:micrococcal nuclease